MTKKEFRSLYLAKRKKLSALEVSVGSERIFQRFTDYFPVSEGQKFHIFLSLDKFNEVNTLPFIRFLQGNGVRIFVPKMSQDKIISIEMLENTPMKENSWGITEPESNEDSGVADFDYIITPLLYCDRHGGRVGYGKGFYDRFFTSVNPECIKVGVGFFEPSQAIEDLTEEDIPLDYLVTPDEILSFKMGF